MSRTIFVGKSSRVIRALLSNPSKAWTTRELAREANVSLGLASLATNRLIDMGFLIRERSMKLRLRKGAELTKRWATVYDIGVWKHKAYYSSGTLYDIGRRIAETANKHSIKYAFTGPFATDLTTQYIRPAEIHVYVSNEKDLKEIVESQHLEIAEIGGNIIFMISKDESVFYGSREINDNRVGMVTLVSETQLILDLYNLTDRTREAAERLIAKESEKKSMEERWMEMVKQFFEQKGLIAEAPREAMSRFDMIFYNPETQERILVELKNTTAKLDSVDQLKNAVMRLGPKTKGVLIAPSITNAALNEMDKANLKFEPMEVIERGSLHKGTS
jgi:hypothetical protein